MGLEEEAFAYGDFAAGFYEGSPAVFAEWLG